MLFQIAFHLPSEWTIYWIAQAIATSLKIKQSSDKLLRAYSFAFTTEHSGQNPIAGAFLILSWVRISTGKSYISCGLAGFLSTTFLISHFQQFYACFDTTANRDAAFCDVSSLFFRFFD